MNSSPVPTPSRWRKRCQIHDTAHYVAARLLGVPASRIRLGPRLDHTDSGVDIGYASPVLLAQVYLAGAAGEDICYWTYHEPEYSVDWREAEKNCRIAGIKIQTARRDVRRLLEPYESVIKAIASGLNGRWELSAAEADAIWWKVGSG